ncbi:MAG: hypothetical protein H0T47_11085 [Planctomycetaceae bacterium]|nr:hypothetical protein [Planctomycetaceae bacterium]
MDVWRKLDALRRDAEDLVERAGVRAYAASEAEPVQVEDEPETAAQRSAWLGRLAAFDDLKLLHVIAALDVTEAASPHEDDPLMRTRLADAKAELVRRHGPDPRTPSPGATA